MEALLVEALLVALGERIGSALCSYEGHVHDHLRILSNKSVDIFPLIAIYIGLNPTIATKDFVKQVDCLTLDFSVSFRCIVSCLSLIYRAPATTRVLVTVRSNLIISQLLTAHAKGSVYTSNYDIKQRMCM